MNPTGKICVCHRQITGPPQKSFPFCKSCRNSKMRHGFCIERMPLQMASTNIL